VVVEMGLPVWRPPAEVYLATFSAASTSSLAAAELLGLTGVAAPQQRGDFLATVAENSRR